jgi:endonuclease/exonuclease/phosphatase family metal-dependent hydrolase
MADELTERTRAGTWRVMTWNILGREQRRLADVAAHIVEQNVDVVALQEVRRGQAHLLARTLGWRLAWRAKHWPYGPAWWLAEGHAILTPHRIEGAQRALLTTNERPWTYRRRIALMGTVHRSGEALRMYNVHLASDSADARIAQARRVAELVHRERDDGGPPLVVCGDLNAHDDEEVLRELAGAAVFNHGTDPTNPANAPRRQLDYVLLPARATQVHVATPEPSQHWRQLSDHLPVTASFVVDGGQRSPRRGKRGTPRN